jgi:hypothetical protein
MSSISNVLQPAGTVVARAEHQKKPARRLDRCPERAPARTATYDRARDLPRLLALWPAEIEDLSIEGRARILKRIERALRAERRRGIAGHWTYDLARHAQLVEAYRQEQAWQEARSGLGADPS